MIGLGKGKVTLSVFLALALGGVEAQASVACSVLVADGAQAAKLYEAPSLEAPLLREVPLDDLVVFPQADLAPTQAAGWAWVRHDPTQQDIWQSGDYGWVPEDLLADCG